MKKQKQDIDNLLEMVVFIAILVFFMLAFSNPPEKSFPDSAHQELVFNHTLDKANAAFADVVRLPQFHKNWASADNKLLSRISENFNKLLNDSKKSNQTIISLQRNQQQIKPINICKFYHYLFPPKSEELPFLG
jgi:hypothetical protein